MYKLVIIDDEGSMSVPLDFLSESLSDRIAQNAFRKLSLVGQAMV